MSEIEGMLPYTLTTATCGEPRNNPKNPSHSQSAYVDEAPLDSDSVYMLAVEDNPADVSLLKQALLEHSVHIHMVVLTDGEKAIRFLERSREAPINAPKLVVLDLNLPKRNGREVLEYIRAQGAWQGVPLVVLSSSSAPRDRDDVTRLGATQYIRKPSDLDEFIAIGSTLKALMRD